MNIDEDELNNKLERIANNYIQIMLWTLNYYHSDCINWRICYNYDYPPLLIDLHKYIPYFDNEIKMNQELNPYHSLCCLVSIIPPSSYNLLPKNIEEYLNNNFDSRNYNILDMNFVYSYCRYFWESHIDDEYSKRININIIEKDIFKLL